MRTTRRTPGGGGAAGWASSAAAASTSGCPTHVTFAPRPRASYQRFSNPKRTSTARPILAIVLARRRRQAQTWGET